jgi:hypothetical protein
MSWTSGGACALLIAMRLRQSREVADEPPQRLPAAHVDRGEHAGRAFAVEPDHLVARRESQRLERVPLLVGVQPRCSERRRRVEEEPALAAAVPIACHRGAIVGSATAAGKSGAFTGSLSPAILRDAKSEVARRASDPPGRRR